MADMDERPPQRPRTKSMLSFGSHKSRDSVPKMDLAETEREKDSRRIKGKADPSVAIREVEPSVRAHEKSTMGSLRSMQHRDTYGNLITDPDRSNPTRPRMERPLDTIRSFEAAIDGGYSRRFTMKPDMQSRRSSYMQGSYGPPRTPGNGAYFDRQPGSRPESVYTEQGYNQNGYSQNGYGQNGHSQNGYFTGQPQPQRRYPPRNNSDPILYGQTPDGYYGHAHNASQDTNTASTSGSYMTDQGTVSTNPSSHNSSNGELNQVSRGMPEETYGINFGGGVASIQEDEYGQPIPSKQGASRNRSQQNYHQAGPQGNGSMAPPPPPPHANGSSDMLRKPAPPVRAASGSLPPQPPAHGYNTPSPQARPAPEKRKSWLARRFSKNG